ncbi:FAD-binding oxidoreductase [bacterium]|nr:FAD-binding oxidoreductase [bacterium]
MLFDRYAKLKKTIPDGSVHIGLKQVMPLLQGKLEKCDPPAVAVEPANLDELCRVIEFAAEKNLKIAVSNGLSPVSVNGLSEQILVLTSRFSGLLNFSKSRASMRVDSGVPIETLAVELASHGQRWMPLHPVPAGDSVGSLIASGWEGFRNWRDGGTMSNIRAIEWIGFDGRVYLSGSSLVGADSPDVSSLLFGSRGKYGIITSVELAVKPLPDARMLVLFELPEAAKAVELIRYLRVAAPAPEAVVYFSELATEILRSANDHTLKDKARVVVAAEWDTDCDLNSEWERYARIESDPKAANGIWQDLFRLPKAAARLSPHRTTARMKLPASAIEDLEDRFRDLSKDYNLGVACWGTLEQGHLHLWILQPDGEARTNRQAGDLLKKLAEDAARLGGCLLDTKPASLLNLHDTAIDELSSQVSDKLLKQCDPMAMYLPLRTY